MFLETILRDVKKKVEKLGIKTTLLLLDGIRYHDCL